MPPDRTYTKHTLPKPTVVTTGVSKVGFFNIKKDPVRRTT